MKSTNHEIRSTKQIQNSNDENSKHFGFNILNLDIVSNFDIRISDFPKRGFTLVEMIVAFGMFAIIMVIAVGSLLSLIEANHKAQAEKTVVNNLHFALENMSRNIRTGSNYHCGFGDASTVTVPTDCPDSPEEQLVFKERDGGYVLYRWDVGGPILRSKSQDTAELLLEESLIPITAPEITIEKLNFYVDGADNTLDSVNSKKQPRVFIILRASMQGKSKVISSFNIQTMVSQRQLDL